MTKTENYSLVNSLVEEAICGFLADRIDQAIDLLERERKCGIRSHIEQARLALSDAMDRVDWFDGKMPQTPKFVEVIKEGKSFRVDVTGIDEYFLES